MSTSAKEAREALAEALWEQHAAEPTDESLEALVIHYEPLARYLARRALAKAPAYQDPEDILSYAHHGLLDALNRFEPGRGAKFETYATRRIAGAIIDGQRRQDPLTRSERKQVKMLTAAITRLEDELKREPSNAEIAAELGIDELEVRQLLLTRMSLNASLDHMLDPDSSSTEKVATFAQEGDMDITLKMDEVRHALAGLLPRLTSRERRFVLHYYCEDRTIRDVARLLGLHETRAGQIRTEIIRALTAA